MPGSSGSRAHLKRRRLIDFLNNEMLAGTNKHIREDSGVGIKPISITGTKRLVRMAIQYALKNNRKSVTIVHKGNIQKFTEGAFREWGYEAATQEFRDQVITERESWIIDNLDRHPGLSVEENAKMVEPGLEFAPQGLPRLALQGNQGRARRHLCDARSRRLEVEADDQ